MIRKKIFLTLMLFLSASIIATLFFVRKMNVKKEGDSEQAVMKVTVVENVDKGEDDAPGLPVMKEDIKEKDEYEPEKYTNIDTASDYVNFERLIMQISEYTTPDEIGNEEE